MSMISAQCDELRKAADELQNLIDNGHNYTWSGFYSTLHYAQQGLRSAADTIWELRCKLAGVVDQSEEVERLKRENAELRKAMDFQALELGCMTDNRDVLYVENKNLRELVRQWYPHMLKRVGRDALEQWGQMDVVKELGVEVDA